MKFLGQKKKRNNNRQGVILVTVLMVMSVAFILIGAIISFVNYNVTITNNNYRKQQAFMTASTYLKSFCADIEKKTTITDATNLTEIQKRDEYVQKLQELAAADGGKGTTTNNIKIDGTAITEVKNGQSTYNMGDVSLTIKEDGSNPDYLVILCKCKYLNQEDQMAAHIQIPSKKKNSQYNNAIEIAGSNATAMENMNVIGGVTRINSAGQEAVTYTLKNNPTIFGSYFVYGSLESSVQSKFALSKAFQKNEDNSYDGAFVTASQNFSVLQNYMEIYTSMSNPTANPHERAYNYLNVGKKLAVSGGGKMYVGGTKSDFANDEAYVEKSATTLSDQYSIDTYCTDFEIAGDASNVFKLNGDLYVKKDALGTIGGDMKINNGARVIIYGDVYVEGDFTCNSSNVTIDGNLTVGGSIVSNSANVKGTTTQLNDSAYKARVAPEIPISHNNYKYTAEYVLGSGDTKVTGITSEYRKFYLPTSDPECNTKTLKSFWHNENNKTVTGNITNKTNDSVSAKFYAVINDSFTLDEATLKNDTDFFNNGGCKKKYLIHVTNKNIVIRMKNMDLDNSRANLFVVLNESPLVDVDGQQARKYGCYFVSDSGDPNNGSLVNTTNEKGEEVKSWSGFHGANVTIDGWGIMDYGTYINTWDPADLGSVDYNGTAKVNPNVILNTTDTPTDQLNNALPASTTEYYYTPVKGNIHVIMTEGSSFKNTNESFFECEFYMPDAEMDFGTRSSLKVHVNDANGDKISAVAGGGYLGVYNIGMIVTKSLVDNNGSYYLFNQPNPSSFWGPLQGSKAVNLVGYKVDRYDRF